MIHPNRAPVKPRVMSPDTGDAIPVEDVLLEVQKRPARAIEITGGAGSGKSTALAHLAAVLPRDSRVVLSDDKASRSGAADAEDATLVFTSLRPHPAPGVVTYRLIPWGDDELLEYLLAVHPSQCGSVMARLQAARDRRLPKGLPEIWRIVLDRMAGDDSLPNVSEALRQELQQGLPTAVLRAGAEQHCLAALTERAREAEKCLLGLGRLHVDARTLGLLRHDAVRLMLAGDCLGKLLETGAGWKRLRKRLPRDLVKAAAKAVSSSARENLARWIARRRKGCQAMAASILHAVDGKWAPDQRSPPVLAGAYLDGAAWKGIKLGGARIEASDLSNSDLSDAVLDGAVAMQASFREALLARASLVKFRGTGADFERAVLARANAGSAVLGHAMLAGADLTDACLRKTDLRAANLTEARLIRADLNHATMMDALIEGADFSQADLSWAWLLRLTLRNACFAGATFAHAHLEGCDLEGMDLPGCDFTKADLEGALLTGSRMPRACFAGAYLRGAGLADVEWEEVDLRDADMRGCTFHLGSSRSGLVGSPIASEGSRTGFYGDDFDQQTYRAPEEIRKANLRGADLRDADLQGTDFYLVDLRDAKYSPRQQEHLRRCGAILVDRA